MSDLSSRTIELSTGVTVPYVEQGDPAGVPVVLLHGYTDSARSFELLRPHLPDALHAFAYTQRGYGDADKPPIGYRVDDYVADLAAFLDAMGLEEAVIVGHSAGSYTAQRFAVAHPERTLGVVLIASFRSFQDNPVVLELWEEIAEMTEPVDPAFAREFQESCIAQPVAQAFVEAMIAGSAQVPARVWKLALAGAIDAEVPTASGTIAAPTLILWGDQDAFCPRDDQHALAAAIPQSRLEIYEGTGHCPHWEQPERAADEIAAFVASLIKVPV